MDSLKEFIQVFKGEANKDNFSELMEKMFKSSERLQEELKTASPEKRKEVFALISALKTSLEQKQEQLFAKLGMNEQQFVQHINNPANFSKEQWEILEPARAYLKTNQTQKPKRKRAQKAHWLVS
jgi:ABC-type Fe3+-citrate transport system substrate-binding protein